LTSHSDNVSSVAFSPDGTLLASGSWDYTIKLWRVSDGSVVRTMLGHTDPVWSVAFSPDGTLLASGSWDNTIKLWQVSDGTEVRTLTGHSSGVASVAFSPDGAELASGSFDGTLRLWKVSDGSLVYTFDQETGSGVSAVQYSPQNTPSGYMAAYGRGDATVVYARVPFAPVGLSHWEVY
jgi:WD40 repeat protein